ncbi:DUF4435 domain-containing protein [Pseudodesulfovibrio indicus]|uniref:Uncharacterized protein DUF4435 n=1 Tax=Pseudodesulfovibrio indicus TaxID=1716143 RepID=A0AA94PRF7_9BACT|nr:DUF4435 domain-containing protein [Pseudodesulfovibrio indicus]TDT92027.1 uncharacterized protein DUF4435 [Pseudodesulfovibrio indicus]
MLRETDYGKALRQFIDKKDNQTLHCFYEGKNDDLYYDVRVIFSTGYKEISTYSCGNRDGVLKALERLAVNSVNNKRLLLFFVDHDFIAPATKHDLLFVTPCYSIENLYISPDVISRVLNKSQLPSKATAKAIRLYKDMLAKFCEAAREWNAWLKAMRLFEHNEDIKKFTVRDSLIKSSLKIQHGTICFHSPIQSPPKQTVQVAPAIADSIEECLDELEEIDECRWGRGKLFHIFIAQFFQILKSDLCKKQGIFKHDNEGTIDPPSFDTVIRKWSIFADTPKELKQFLDMANEKLREISSARNTL